ncbi:MAG: ABC transporter permease subunit [Pseudomonadota bacterium]
MSGKTGIIFRRELNSYFSTPLALVFTVIFLVLSGIFTFQISGFYDRGQADLQVFFRWLPWLYLILVPAISMGLWSDERKTGTIELLLTLPVSIWNVVIGKFLAAWLFICISLALTFPLWITVNYLGDPDNGVILSSYFASALMAGGFLAVGSLVSATTKNQIIAFIMSLVICFLFVVSGESFILEFFDGWMPEFIVNAIESFSFITYFESFNRGLVDLRNILFFCGLIIVWLMATAIIIDMKKAD